MHDLPSLTTWLPTLAPSEVHTLAVLWGIQAVQPEQLMDQLTDPAGVQRLWDSISPAERAAMEMVLAAGGRLVAASLEREWGTVRQHTGFVNPRAYLNALSGVPSPVERLFVLGLLQRLPGTQGFDYAVPREWFALLPTVAPVDATPRLEEISAPRHQQPGDPLAFEHDLVMLLIAAYREPLVLNPNGSLHRSTLARLAEQLLDHGAPPAHEQHWPEAAFLRVVALNCGLLHERQGALRVAPGVIEWLQQPPLERLRSMLSGWLESRWDELSALCDLRWRTPPLKRPGRRGRQVLLEFLRTVAPDGWFSLPALVAELRRTNPDLLRSGAEYTSWQLATSDGELVTGFNNWQQVEGALIKALVAGPLHWLGLIDLGGAVEPTAARISQWGRAVFDQAAPPAVGEVGLKLSSAGAITVDDATPPFPRFQVGRIATWHQRSATATVYRLSSRSFDEALERGIGHPEIERFLGQWTEAPIPEQLATQLADWEQRRTTLQARPTILLEANQPGILAEIARNRRLTLPAYTSLSPVCWAFDFADGQAMVAALRDGGYGLAATFEPQETPLAERDLGSLLTAALACSLLTEHQGREQAISSALLERLRRLLPSAARAQAERAAHDLASLLGCPQRDEEYDA